VANQYERREFQVVRKGNDIAAEVLNGAFVRPAGRASMAAQVACHDFMRSGKEKDLVTPILVAAEKAVHEDQGRGAPPLADEVQPYSSAAAAGLCAATSFC
jgi:hypothetical protein